MATGLLLTVYLFISLRIFLIWNGALCRTRISSRCSSDCATVYASLMTMPLIVSHTWSLWSLCSSDRNSTTYYFGLSIVPLNFTIAMIGKRSYGVPGIELPIYGLLILGFLGNYLVGGKNYRIGILIAMAPRLRIRLLWNGSNQQLE